MSSPPEVLLEPDDNKAFQAMLKHLGQMKRMLSFKIGKPGTSIDEMHAARSLRNMLGENPSQARMNLVGAQGQLTREELLKQAGELEGKAFETVSSFEMFASKVEENTEESIDEKRKEVLRGVEEYRARVQQAIDHLESLTSFPAGGGLVTPPCREGSPGQQGP